MAAVAASAAAVAAMVAAAVDAAAHAVAAAALAAAHAAARSTADKPQAAQHGPPRPCCASPVRQRRPSASATAKNTKQGNGCDEDGPKITRKITHFIFL